MNNMTPGQELQKIAHNRAYFISKILATAVVNLGKELSVQFLLFQGDVGSWIARNYIHGDAIDVKAMNEKVEDNS